MRAVWNGVTLAESKQVFTVEGNVYFPPQSLRRQYFVESKMVSLCPWKGVARYYTIEARGQRNEHAAWYYPRPWPWIRKIRDYVAFWNGVDIEP